MWQTTARRLSGITLAALMIVGCGRDVRFATFNASLTRDQPGRMQADLQQPGDKQINAVAEIVQRVRPDVLLLNEFDYDQSGKSLAGFEINYLAVSHNGSKPIKFKYSFIVPTNTGVPTGVDMNGDGKVISEPGSADYAADAQGWGEFPGRYAFVILSNYPIDHANIRSSGEFLWKELPNNRMPTTYYSQAAQDVMRLSSKNHVDVPIRINGRTVHVIAAHPTPPVFDGPEDRNGLRNHDEIKLVANMIENTTYVDSASGPDWARGKPKPLVRQEPFVVMGDLNADPNDGDSVDHAIRQLLNHPLINSSFTPTSLGAQEAATQQGGKNNSHVTPANTDTADWNDTRGSGNLRIDYVLPSKSLNVNGGGVFWPASSDPLHSLIKDNLSSDHRLVWLDVRVR